MDTKVYQLFQSYGQNYKEVFQNVAVDILTEETTAYTAYDFFWKRLIIKDDFETVNKFNKFTKFNKFNKFKKKIK